MYEKHIEALQNAISSPELEPDEIEACRAAIALMRAAEPKDEAAEREACRRAATEIELAPLIDRWRLVAETRASVCSGLRAGLGKTLRRALHRNDRREGAG